MTAANSVTTAVFMARWLAEPVNAAGCDDVAVPVVVVVVVDLVVAGIVKVAKPPVGADTVTVSLASPLASPDAADAALE